VSYVARLALFLAVAAVVLGCGGDEPSDLTYEQAFSEISRGISFPSTSVPEGLSQATNVEEVAAVLRPYGEIIGKAATDYGALEPPQAIAAEHDRWVDFLHQMSSRYLQTADDVLTVRSGEEVQAILDRTVSWIELPANQQVMVDFAQAVADEGLDLENPFIEPDAAEAAPPAT